ncbi:hypothetical protein ACHAWO_000966 [Cyclotella atomus]|uniref:Uncharacterized protein n=1 Tax=Cyclotella atomus TaxID=382360 RepID=A0ABD3MMN0_9STRA
MARAPLNPPGPDKEKAWKAPPSIPPMTCKTDRRPVEAKRKTLRGFVSHAAGIQTRHPLQLSPSRPLKSSSTSSIRAYLTPANSAPQDHCLSKVGADEHFSDLMEEVHVDEVVFVDQIDEILLTPQRRHSLSILQAQRHIEKGDDGVSVGRNAYRRWICDYVIHAIVAQWPDWEPKKPPNSPDFNICDLAEFRAMQSLQQQHRTKNVDELIEVVKKCWNDFPLATSKKAWTTLQLIFDECLKVDGANNYKLPHMQKEKWIREHGGAARQTIKNSPKPSTTSPIEAVQADIDWDLPTEDLEWEGGARRKRMGVEMRIWMTLIWMRQGLSWMCYGRRSIN